MDEVLKSIEWHHLLFLFLVIFIAIFQGPLSQFLSRITTITKSGITALPVPDAQSEQKKEISKLLSIGKSALLTEEEDNIYKELKEKHLDIEGDTIKILVSHLAIAQMRSSFEYNYNTIFGSQIRLLKIMNEQRSGMSENVIQRHFLDIKERYSNEFKYWEINNYLKFLFDNILIINQNEMYYITVRGIEFLTWLSKEGRIENKSL